MKAIGLLLMFLSLYNLQRGYIDLASIFMMFVGLAFLFFEVVVAYLKSEIRVRARRR